MRYYLHSGSIEERAVASGDFGDINTIKREIAVEEQNLAYPLPGVISTKRSLPFFRKLLL
jgi:hypothetical protein